MNLTYKQFTAEFDGKEVSIAFTAKPNDETRSTLKNNKFRWNPRLSQWTGPSKGAADFLDWLGRQEVY